LLNHENKGLTPTVIYNSGKSLGNEEQYERVPEDDKKSHSLHLETPLYYEPLTRETRNLIEQKIESLKKELTSRGVLSPKDREDKEEELEKLEKFLD
jgi:hypothetical protein